MRRLRIALARFRLDRAYRKLQANPTLANMVAYGEACGNYYETKFGGWLSVQPD